MDSGGTGLNVAVVDDDPAICDALVTLLEPEGWTVRAFGSGAEFLRAAQQMRPDCVLLDVHMPERSGLDVLAAIGGARFPAPVIIITGYGDIPMAVAAIKAGAHDFIEKPFDGEAVIERVRDAVRDRTQPVCRLGLSFPGMAELTSREMDVLEQIVSGCSNKEVGRILGISPRTVEVHRARVMEKLGARNTADLMRIVLRGGGTGDS
jgi:two-component system, LuxR family, response regulator FixJ